MSNTDLKVGFYQIQIDLDDIEDTAFTAKYGQYDFNELATGLCNASTAFQIHRN